MQLPGEGGGEALHYFLRLRSLPGNRAPYFPIFFNAGNTRYNAQSSSDRIEEIIGLLAAEGTKLDNKCNTEVIIDLRKLAEAVRVVGDRIEEEDQLLTALIGRGRRLPVLPHVTSFMSHLITHTKSITNEFAGFFDNIIFIKLQFLLTKQSLAETLGMSGSSLSHLQQPPGYLKNERSSSCLTPSDSFDDEDETLDLVSEEFTPEIFDDEDDEGYRFQCSSPGLFQCSVTGLVFDMEGEGEVVYRTVPWDRRLLEQHHKQPAGPLFDIQCVQLSLCQLHLPHCEIRSTAGPDFLSVAHVKDEGIDFVSPQKITDTHVIIRVTSFSGFGNVKEEQFPPDPIRALVLLFYCPPLQPDPESSINVLMLPRNVVLRKVLSSLYKDEIYMKIPPHCDLVPKHKYKLTESPEDDLVQVQPQEAKFDSDDYENYFPSFQVSVEKVMKHIKLILTDSDSSHSVWEGRVRLSSSRVKTSCGQGALGVPADDRLLEIRSSFIQAASEPVIKGLVDRLLDKTVLTDPDREKVEKTRTRDDKARLVIDTVRLKGEDAASLMIDSLCELDPFLCQHLQLQ